MYEMLTALTIMSLPSPPFRHLSRSVPWCLMHQPLSRNETTSTHTSACSIGLHHIPAQYRSSESEDYFSSGSSTWMQLRRHPFNTPHHPQHITLPIISCVARVATSSEPPHWCPKYTWNKLWYKAKTWSKRMNTVLFSANATVTDNKSSCVKPSYRKRSSK